MRAVWEGCEVDLLVWSLDGGWLRIERPSSRKGEKIRLSIAKVLFHGDVCTSSDGATIPIAEILEEDWLFGENNISQVYTLHVSVRLAGMFRQVGDSVNSVEDGVNWEQEVKVHVGDLQFTLTDLLRGNASVGSEEMG